MSEGLYATRAEELWRLEEGFDALGTGRRCETDATWVLGVKSPLLLTISRGS